MISEIITLAKPLSPFGAQCSSSVTRGGQGSGLWGHFWLVRLTKSSLLEGNREQSGSSLPSPSSHLPLTLSFRVEA